MINQSKESIYLTDILDYLDIFPLRTLLTVTPVTAPDTRASTDQSEISIICVNQSEASITCPDA